ncbi:TIGR02285 family protein [Desulfobulbus sp.]|uniref:TIGR02285 family protein n=1 Tax=Desulfobulbus sp. TaxID=895 RepID=UPI00286EFC1E|nr:TIGR02285 family protein [Desulfobulbus sp.]
MPMHCAKQAARPWFLFAVPVLGLLLVVLAAKPLPAGDSITWMEPNMPPFTIQDGPAKNQGYGDIVTTVLQRYLSEYDHFIMITNVTRHFQKFRDGEKVCGVGLFRTPEREAFMYFSLPSLLVMPPAFIVKKDRQAEFGPAARVSLESLLQNRRIVIGLSRDRSYGAPLDAILARHRQQAQLVYYNGQQLTDNYLRMLMLDRIDGLLVLPDEALYHAEKMGLRDRITALTVEETQRDYRGWMSAVACPKNAWGKEVIDKVNAILLAQRPTAPYQAAYERWLDGAALERYRTLYREVFLTSPY